LGVGVAVAVGVRGNSVLVSVGGFIVLVAENTSPSMSVEVRVGSFGGLAQPVTKNTTIRVTIKHEDKVLFFMIKRLCILRINRFQPVFLAVTLSGPAGAVGEPRIGNFPPHQSICTHRPIQQDVYLITDKLADHVLTLLRC
jgi:hypothetical protein